MHNRKEKEALNKGRYVEMEQSMLQLITTSQHISRGNIPHFFVNTQFSNPRKSAQLVECEHKKAN
jgi:hypothetical protein